VRAFGITLMVMAFALGGVAVVTLANAAGVRFLS